MRRAILGVAVLLSACAPSGPAPVATAARAAEGPAGVGDLRSMGECSPSGPIVGALPDAPPPGWCTDLPLGVSTAERGASAWLDTFKGRSHGALGTDYRVFEAPLRDGNVFRSTTFAHHDHWMVDVATHGTPATAYEGDPRDLEQALDWGGALMRPIDAFHAHDGTVALEVDVSAGMAVYGYEAWPEIVITTADRPTGVIVDPLHAIGVFGGAPAVGCQLIADRRPICTGHDASGRPDKEGGLLFNAAATDASRAWRICSPTDPDDRCRDRFRLEISRSGLTLTVNGSPALATTGQIPEELLTSPVYVYFGSWIYLGREGIVRFHWGRIEVD